MLKKNAIIPLEITDITNEGNGVGRADGMAVFVPFTVVGDKLKVRVVKVLSHYAFGIIEEMLSPAACRLEDDCPIYRRCGSCSLRHISYEQELLTKNSWVEENMRRIGKLMITLPPAIPSPQADRYRNKAIYPVRLQNGKPIVGFFAKRSHRVEPAEDCLLHPVFFGEIAAAFCRWLAEFNVSIYDETTHNGLVRALYIRHAEATGEVMVTIITNGSAIPQTDALIKVLRSACTAITSVILNINCDKTNVLLGQKCQTLWGESTITDRLCGLSFSLSPLSFYQVNRRAAEQLYGIAKEFAALSGGEVLLDLYCGAGTIGLSMAHQAGQLIGVEIVSDAVKNARQNAAQNGIANARFICADAAEAAAQLEAEGIAPNVIILDPPRKGCTPDLIKTTVRMAPDRIVMVSCNSATAARDVALFSELGYIPQKIQAVDMFPRTAHVEAIIMMTKCGSEGKK
ncbi:23S rRNA (uracil(1939)-C(5))-methyltransferase RlmD [Oscillospiraceae bacterium LTW-04]|nr:23S rRNA (uracil(1939)-C(5))-methyltransferase RlmD [Oscillospiraceae bacterium MB24-C1]